MSPVVNCPVCQGEVGITFYGSYNCPACSTTFSWFDNTVNTESARVEYFTRVKPNVNLAERSY